jgi:hypothetical protein
MERTASGILRWTGRGLILLAVFILVASLFLPDAVSPLSPLVCPDGTELSNARYTPPRAPENEKLELVCTSASYTESAAKPVLGVVVGLIAVGTIAIWIASSMIRKPVVRPQVPQAR